VKSRGTIQEQQKGNGSRNHDCPEEKSHKTNLLLMW
jgi:hypothetical protein